MLSLQLVNKTHNPISIIITESTYFAMATIKLYFSKQQQGNTWPVFNQLKSQPWPQ